MHPIVAKKRPEIEALCRRFHVRRLQLFGSATGENFNLDTSDVDFAVEFEDLDVLAYGDAYFGLLEQLELLLGRHVDLVTTRSLRNPFFKKRLEEAQVPLYAR